MKNKLVAVVCALLVLGIGSYVILNITKKKTTVGDKEISVTIENRLNEEVDIIYQGKITTDKEYLGGALDELVGKNAFSMEASDSGFGRYIISFNQIEGSGIGAYWMFESDNNEVCVENGFCSLGMDMLPINDNDHFIFYLSNSNEY